MTVLEVSELKKSFTHQRQMVTAVDGISFSIEEGECFGLVGESGSGKSTTAAIIAGLLKADSGTIRFMDNEMTEKKRKTARRQMQMVFQNPEDSFDSRFTVGRCIMEGARNYKIYSKAELRERAASLLEAVGLEPSLMNRKIHDLSGGQCQRVAIARAVIAHPKLIIFDEATSALDVSVQAQIIELIGKMQKKYGHSFLFITHDLPLAASICDKIAVMHAGHIVEAGDGRSVLENPRHPYTRLLVSCILPVSGGAKKELPDLSRFRDKQPHSCSFYPWCPYARDVCLRAPEMVTEADGRSLCCHIRK